MRDKQHERQGNFETMVINWQ